MIILFFWLTFIHNFYSGTTKRLLWFDKTFTRVRLQADGDDCHDTVPRVRGTVSWLTMAGIAE